MRTKSKKKKTGTVYENEIRLRNMESVLYDKISKKAAAQKRSTAAEVIIHLEKTYK